MGNPVVICNYNVLLIDSNSECAFILDFGLIYSINLVHLQVLLKFSVSSFSFAYSCVQFTSLFTQIFTVNMKLVDGCMF